MKPLPTEFQSGGFHFRQLTREGRVVLLVKTKPPATWRDYEVVILETRPATTFMGKPVPAREVMPPSETWGTRGWSPHDEPAARARFAAVVQERKLKHRHNAPLCTNCLA